MNPDQTAPLVPERNNSIRKNLQIVVPDQTAPFYFRVRTGLKSTLEGFHENYLKIKSALKSTGKSRKGIEKSLNSAILCKS